MNRMYRRLRSVLAVWAVIALLCAGSAAAAGSNTRVIDAPKRMINIVLDDSGSMYGNRIITSLYALEVFGAMLNEQDVLNIYTLNQKTDKPILTLKGNDQSRTNQLHGVMTKYSTPSGGTPYQYTETAAKALIAASAEYEKWLVILSDGEYAGKSDKEVQADLDSWNGREIHTVFLSIDPGNRTGYRDNGTMGRYFPTATKDLLKTVSEISNIIFGNLALPVSRIKTSGNTYSLDIDIPIDQLIVFVQGENASLGDVKRDGSAGFANAVEHIVRSQGSTGNLVGRVVRFDLKGGSFLEGGTYSVEVNSAQTVEFYYRPAVDLECSLVTSGVIYAGEPQEAELYFCHPTTRARITSDLLKGARMFVTIINNGKEVVKNQEPGPDGKISVAALDEGTAEVSAYATLPGYVTLRKQAQIYEVKRKIKDMEFTNTSSTGGYWSIRQIELKDNTTLFMGLIVVEPDNNNTPIDEATWNITDCDGVPAHGVKLKLTKDGCVSPEFRLYPSAEGKVSDVETGVVEFTVNVITDGFSKANTVRIEIIPFVPVKLQDASARFDQFRLGSGNTTEYVEIHAVDPDTGTPPSDEIMKYITLSVESDSGQGLNWKIDKTGTNGVWKLIPQAAGRKADISTGTRTLRIKTVYDDGTDFTGQKALVSEAAVTVEINPTQARNLTLEDDVPAAPYRRARWNLNGSTPIGITAKYNGSVLPSSAWNWATDGSLTLTPAGNDRNKKMDFEIRKGTAQGTWEIHLKPYKEKGYRTSYGRFEYEVHVEIYDETEEVPYSGTLTIAFEVEPDWWDVIREFWYDHWWKIIAAIWALGMIFKKKFYFGALLRLRKLSVMMVGPKEIGEEQETITKKMVITPLQMMTYILPFLSQRITIPCSDALCKCRYVDIKAKAFRRSLTSSGRARFKMRNKNYDMANISTVSNQQFANSEVLRKKELRLTSFSIQGKNGFGSVSVIKKDG